MAIFRLRPATLRANRIVVQEAPAIELSLPEMFKRFAVSGAQEARRQILRLRPTQFFGLMKDETGVVRNFTIFNHSRDNKVDWLLKRDPTFSTRLLEVYEVEFVQLDAKIIAESSSEST